MEALAAGVPLVVRDLPVTREIFSGTAYFADDVPSMAAAILRALGPRDQVRSAAGRALAAQHTWDAATRAHLEFYSSLSVESRPDAASRITGSVSCSVHAAATAPGGPCRSTSSR